MTTPETQRQAEDRRPLEGYIEYTLRGPILDLTDMSAEERDAALSSDFTLASGSPYKPNGSHIQTSKLVITKFQEG